MIRNKTGQPKLQRLHNQIEFRHRDLLQLVGLGEVLALLAVEDAELLTEANELLASVEAARRSSTAVLALIKTRLKVKP